MASHLHVPLQEVMRKTTSSEFVLWMKYLDEEPNHFHREDYYWAQIAAEIRMGNVKRPKHVKVKNFIIPFKTETKKSSSKADRLHRSKQYWMGRLGVEEQ